MRLVIVGAGEIGRAMAAHLSQEGQDVILVDSTRSLLEHAAERLDIAVRQGNGTDWVLLEELMELEPDLIAALTGSDETNLVCASLAKGLGYPTTVARVRQASYLNLSRIDCGRLFSVDHFVSPEYIAAQDLARFVQSLGSTHVENFALGTVQMRSLIIPPRWKEGGIPLSELSLPEGVMAALISREGPHHRNARSRLIFPHGQDSFLPGDEVTFIGQTEAMQKIHHRFGISQPHLHSALIIGGGLVGRHTARLLMARGMRVHIVDRDREACVALAEQLPTATILHHEGADLAFLKEQRVAEVDAFICTTRSDQTNVLLALMAREAGCDHIIARIDAPDSAATLRHNGIVHLVSPQISTANRLLSITRAGAVTSTSSLYNNRAKILELRVSLHSKISGIPLSALGPYLPNDFLVAVIRSRGRTLIARGERILCPGDTAIIITSPDNADEVVSLF